jgi:thioredoxin reductase
MTVPIKKAVVCKCCPGGSGIKGLFAAGDVQGSKGALAAANNGGMAATSIAHEWYD